MNLATLISSVASALLLATGGMFVIVAQAPGWERARMFAVIAFSAALYAGVDTVCSLPGLSVELVQRLWALNFLLAAVHCSAWIVAGFSSPLRPWRDLPGVLRGVVGVTLGLGLLALHPETIAAPGLRTIDLPELGAVYRVSNTTPFAGALALWLLLVLLLPFARFVSELRQGKQDALLRVVGFTLFFGCAVGEALFASGHWRFLSLGDLGFLCLVLTLLAETARRILRDARSLQHLDTELANLVSRRTLERDQAREALAVAERHAALGQLAAGVGHEVNNPLTYIRANLQQLRSAFEGGSTPADALELVEDALVGTTQIQRVVADLRAYALPSVEHREPLDVAAELASALKLVGHELPPETEVRWHRGSLDPVMADPVRLRQVLVNLLLNAALAMREAKRSAPCLGLRLKRSGAAELSIEVVDNGVGISVSALSRLGEPYFSTRLERGGTGLGLFVARGILDALGGRLEFESTLGEGTTARVILPTHGSNIVAASDVSRQERKPPLLEQASLRVLVVDDEPAVARAIARQLADLEVSVVHTGRAAVERLLGREPVDVVLCDVMMPGGSGQDVYDAIAEQAPQLLSKLVFITGGATVPEVALFLKRDGVRHLAKPFERYAFDQAVEDMTRLSA